MERLVGLYLLTVCDIRATGPKIWNAWKAQLLEDLFYSTARFLKGKGIDRDLLVSRRRKDALRMTRFTPEQRDRINKFWDNFDVAYFMKHSVRNIVWHAKVLLPHLDSSKSFVASRPLRGMEHAHEILILTQDRPELFARIVSNLQQYGLSIAEARIHTGRDGRVVDSFIVVDDGSDPNFEQEFAHFQEILGKTGFGRKTSAPSSRTPFTSIQALPNLTAGFIKAGCRRKAIHAVHRHNRQARSFGIHRTCVCEVWNQSCDGPNHDTGRKSRGRLSN